MTGSEQSSAHRPGLIRSAPWRRWGIKTGIWVSAVGFIVALVKIFGFEIAVLGLLAEFLYVSIASEVNANDY